MSFIEMFVHSFVGSLFVFVLGISLLYLSSSWLVIGALKIGKYFNLSEFVASFFIVGLGTSLPELFVSTSAVLSNLPSIALGNVIGSNLANSAFGLGFLFFLCPKTKDFANMRVEFLISLGFSIVLCILMWNDILSILDGLILLILYAGVVWYHFYFEKTDAQVQDHVKLTKLALWLSFALVILGVGLLQIGTQMVIIGGTQIAYFLKISDKVISLIFLSVGTSLPELAVTVTSVLKKQYDIASGNLIGSNTLNIGIITGVMSLFSFGDHPLVFSFAQWKWDLILLCIMNLILLPFFITKIRFYRFAGIIMGVIYINYLIVIWLKG